MHKRKPGQPRKGWKDAARKRHERSHEAIYDAAFANGVRSALQRLWDVRERSAFNGTDAQAWADCDAMIAVRRQVSICLTCGKPAIGKCEGVTP